MPVLGSGHPQADIFMVKHAPRPSEVEEGVAFYGRTGNALMKSLKRLNIDPLAVYGTLCVKCPVLDPVMADPACIARLGRGADDRRAEDRRGDGARGARAWSTTSTCRCAASSCREPGVVQRFTPSIEALYVPNIDDSLDEEAAKREFWSAFKVLGEWWTPTCRRTDRRRAQAVRTILPSLPPAAKRS